MRVDTGRVQRSDLDRPPATDRPKKQRRAYPLKWVIVALVVAGVVVLVLPWIYINVIESPAPSKLHLPTVAGASASVAPGPVSGTWKIGAGSVAGYRVHESLFGQSNTAVGRTSQVTGGMVISGTQVTAAQFSVDMASIKSNTRSRDAQFNGFIMDTSSYPHGSFQLTRPIDLGRVPAVGQTVTVPATGNLTLRGVTRPVTFELNAERLSGAIDVNAEIPITYSLWHIPNPSFAVAQLGRTGTVEVLLHLVRQS